MIRAVYRPGQFRLTLSGHARSGAFGQDLVCAATSALAVTLAETVTALQAEGRVKAAVTRLRSGAAEVCCRPRLGHRRAVGAVFDAVALGYARLAREYPDYLEVGIEE